MIRPLVRLVLAGAIASVVWLVSVTSSQVTVVAPVLQDALPLPEAEFSLDARFVSPFDASPLYVLEQRAAPMHRIVRIDPATGAQETVWSVPEGSLVHAISLSPDRELLALAVTDDYADPGNDLVLVELATGEHTEVWSSDEGDHLTDLVWDLDGSAIWATRIRGDVEGPQGLSVVAVGVATGVIVDEIPLAVSPAPLPGGVAVLDVDPSDGARRSLTVLAEGGSDALVPTADAPELDHLVYDPAGRRLLVAALVEPEGGATFGIGTVAEASSAGLRPSEWISVGLRGTSRTVEPVEAPTTIVYDAVITGDGHLAAVTREGLVLLAGDPDPSAVQVMASRAFRKVTG